MSDSPTGGDPRLDRRSGWRSAFMTQRPRPQAQRAACGVGCGVGEVQEVIRAQPIVAVLVAVAVGYLPAGSRRKPCRPHSARALPSRPG
jgi:hypothetical protein